MNLIENAQAFSQERQASNLPDQAWEQTYVDNSNAIWILRQVGWARLGLIEAFQYKPLRPDSSQLIPNQ